MKFSISFTLSWRSLISFIKHVLAMLVANFVIDYSKLKKCDPNQNPTYTFNAWVKENNIDAQM